MSLGKKNILDNQFFLNEITMTDKKNLNIIFFYIKKLTDKYN